MYKKLKIQNQTMTLKDSRLKLGLGFTLIELLVVVAIIGLLASIISYNITTTRIRARDTRRISDLKQIKTGMDLYFAESNGGYPDDGAWIEGTTLQCDSKIIMQIPSDPLPTTYDYNFSALGTSFTGCGSETVWSDYEVEFYIESTGLYYIMDSDGNLRERDSGSAVTPDELI